MATRQVILSDISGTELTDDTHVKVIVKHPDFNYPLELDLSSDEASKIVESPLRLVTFTIYESNKAPREVTAETKTVDKLFANFDDVLASARRAEVPAQKVRATRGSGSKSTGDKVDYTAPDNFGKLHRGRITDEEKALVRDNRDQASANRQAQTGSPIDWSDAKEQARYGL